MEEIYRDYSPNFCEIGDNKPEFCLKIVNGWIQSTSFGKSSILKKLNVSMGSEYVFDYAEIFPITINWDFHFESFRNFSNLNSTLLKYLKQKFSH